MEDENSMNELLRALRENWKFPAVVHFCRVFEGVLGLHQFSSDQLERALLNPGDHPVFLSELVSRLLSPGRKLSQNPEAWPSWEPSLQKKVKANWSLVLKQDPLLGKQFADLSSAEKLDVLYLLTEVALQNSSTLRETIRNTVEDPYLTADSVRCLPIGENGEGEKFFLFSLRYEDCRLYKQSPGLDDKLESAATHDGEAPVWTTVTTTLRELQEFVTEVRRSRNPAEKKLHKYLAGILPEFERTERHRKKVEEKANAREQTPLLKRSSRLQEQAKRKEEEEKGISLEDKELSPGGDTKEEAQGEDDQSLDIGISREERMRLRNRRRELAEEGLRKVLTGKKRMLEYDGLTPLGPSIKCLTKQRIQSVRPPRQVNKLVSIIWEKFRRPMHHRKQFEIHLEAAKKRRLSYLQHRHDFGQKPRTPVYIQRQHYDSNLDSRMRSLAEGGIGRASYPIQQNLMMNFLPRHRPSSSAVQNYGIPTPLQMPPPLQQNVGGESTRQSLEPILQQYLTTLQPSSQDHILKLPLHYQQSVLANSLKRQSGIRQHFPRPELDQNQPISLHHQGVAQQPGDAIQVAGLTQFGYPHLSGSSGSIGGGASNFISPYITRQGDSSLTPQAIPRGLNQHTGRFIPGLTHSSRNVQSAFMSNQLSPSLVPLPPSIDGIMNSSWSSKFPTVVGGGRPDSTRLAMAQPIYPCPDQQINTSIPLVFENGANWQRSPQFHSSHVTGDTNRANNRLQHMYLDPDRDSRRSSNDAK
eukprot:g8602.t1